MIGRLFFKNFRLAETDSGEIELTLSALPKCKYAVKQMVRDMRAKDKEFSATIDIRKHARSLDQNALMWALLTIYAEAQGGGRRGSVTPEDIYYRMLSKYGVAEFVMTLPEAEDALKSAFRVVSKVDTRFYNGKQMAVFKCYYGSSTYDTKQMSVLIDGIFDELAEIGVDASTSHDVATYYEDWREFRAKADLPDMQKAGA